MTRRLSQVDAVIRCIALLPYPRPFHSGNSGCDRPAVSIARAEITVGPARWRVNDWLMPATHNDKESHESSGSSLGLREDVSKTGRLPCIEPADQVSEVAETGTLQDTGGD